jgi:hypothetical protein
VLNRGGDPVGAARFPDLRSVPFAIAFLFSAIWLIGVGTRALRTRALRPARAPRAAVARLGPGRS